MQGITLVKSDGITLAAAGTDAVVVDLGLGIEEAAKILGILVSGFPATPTGAARLEMVYSFDPEDTAIDPDDDEQFFHAVVSVLMTTQGARIDSETTFANYIGMNLITTRNLAFIVQAVGTAGGIAKGKVYYEKFKPTDRELVTLIAQRR